VGGEIFPTCPVRPWGPPNLLYNGYRVFPGVKCGRGVTLTPHSLLVLWPWKSRAIPLLLLWAVRPVQSLSIAIPLLPLWAVQPVQSLTIAIPLLPLWAVRPVRSLSRAIPLLPLWTVRPVQSLSTAIPLLPLWTVRPVQSLSITIPLLPLLAVRPVQSLSRPIPLPTPMRRTACAEPQFLYKGALYLPLGLMEFSYVTPTSILSSV
jgi:hypothetical protein